MFLRNEKNHPVGCLAIDFNAKKNQLKYQLSVLNPADRFDRKMARHLALGRMLETPIHISNLKYKASEMSLHYVFELVMNDLVQSNVPSRAKKAAHLWLTNNLRAR